MFLFGAYPHGSASIAALAGGEIWANRQVCPTIFGGSAGHYRRNAGFIRQPHTGLFADEMQGDAARVSANAVFPHINPLPGAEREPPAAHGNAQVHRRQRRANVRGHVVIAFERMHKKRIAVGDKPFKKRLQIAPHVRVGVFLNQQRGRSMLQMNRQQAVLELVLIHPLFNFARELAKPTTAGWDR